MAILFNLLEQLYVRGSLSNVESLLVDIGTGYFVEKASQPTPYYSPLLLQLLPHTHSERERERESREMYD